MQMTLSWEDRPTAGLSAIDALETASLPRCRWYFFKEAFSSAVVEKAIEYAECKPGDLVVDPFVGSGTVPLVASESALVSRGLEVNHFLDFVSRTKLVKYT